MAQVSTGQVRLAKVCIPQIGVNEFATLHVSMRQPRKREAGVAQVNVIKHGLVLSQLHAPQVDAGEEQSRFAGMPGTTCQDIHGCLDVDRAIRKPRQFFVTTRIRLARPIGLRLIQRCVPADKGSEIGVMLGRSAGEFRAMRSSA
jgi:hypothetical protein